MFWNWLDTHLLSLDWPSFHSDNRYAMPREWQFHKKVVQLIWNTNVRADVNLFVKSLPNVVHEQGRDKGFVPRCVGESLAKLADVCLSIIATVMDDTAGHLLLTATHSGQTDHTVHVSDLCFIPTTTLE